MTATSPLSIMDLIRSKAQYMSGRSLACTAAHLSGPWLARSVHWNALTPLEREGLACLYDEPLYATTEQIYSGGHRIAAMRQQRVRWALGQCLPGDVGKGVPDLHAYLPA